LILILITVACVGTAIGVNFIGPGEPLYQVKITLERIPITLPVLSESDKVKKEMELAQNRQNEITTIINSEENGALKSQRITSVAKELVRNIKSAQNRVERISRASRESKEPQTGEAKKVANLVKDKISGINQNLQASSLVVQKEKINKSAQAELKKVNQSITQAELFTLGILLADSSKVLDKTQSGQEQEDEKQIINTEEQKVARQYSGQAEKTEKKELKTAEDSSIFIPPVVNTQSATGTSDINLFKEGVSDKTDEGDIAKDLEQMIQELETDVQEMVSKKDVVNEESETATSSQSEVKQGLIILEVEQVIADEMLKTKLIQQQKTADEYLDLAKKELKDGRLKETLENVNKVVEILKVIK
jgi:hypothetical protein